VLVRIRCLAENDLTTLMVLHDFLSKRLVPLQDRPRLTWMYTGVNDIMQLHHRPGSSLDEDLLAASLKTLTTYQFLAELVVPLAVCEPICVNQVVRTPLLLLPTPDTGPYPLHRARFPWQVVVLERRLGAGAGGRSRPARTSCRCFDPPPH
jgi:hypothetical protein